MTTELTGRALDEACAKAMGVEWDPSARDGTQYSLPTYSTDWLRVPEMLAWLRERGWPVRIVEGRGSVDAHRWYVESYKPSVEKLAMASGSNIPEALARLVVRVAALENKEQA